ncbi:MAG: DUF3365 domain-containing protein [Lachnospiraceae bacterium]|nr:DUF3365 domain-containing protein [Lachnospiraceae bacterium]
MKKHLTLQTKFILTFSVTILVTFVFFLAGSAYTQKKQMERELAEKAKVMAAEMDAVWEFITINQDRINYTSDGVYEFKGLYCSLAGKSVGELFSRDQDYQFHYTNLNPRNPQDEPDAFEREALELLLQDRELSSVYRFDEYEGNQVFRYVAPLSVLDGCLACHGEPYGERDVTGYPKEGWKLGDIGGAISIIVPLDIHWKNFTDNLWQEVAFFSLLIVVIGLMLYFFVYRLVLGPLHILETAVQELRGGNWKVQAYIPENHKEMSQLARYFNEMAVQLRGLYEHLEEQVEDRTSELKALNRVLEETNDQLKKENRSKSDFLAVMTHELRTPLTSIITFTEFLLENEAAHPEEENDTLHRIEQNGKRLLETINNTLAIFRLEADEMKLSLETVDIYDLINELEEWAEPLALKKNIRLSMQVDKNVPLFNADYEMLYHTLENLLGNALKFTEENGQVSLRAAFLPEACRIRLSVRDTGIGIAKEYQEAVFDKFVQMDASASKRYNGSGLGLTLVKNWTKLHGGTVAVESEPGKGSTFTVEIPSDLQEEGEQNGNEDHGSGR